MSSAIAQLENVVETTTVTVDVKPKRKYSRRNKKEETMTFTIAPANGQQVNPIINTIKKLQAIRIELADRVVERDDEIQSMLLATILGENVLFLGKPGTGKTYLADEFFKHVEEAARKFKWMMNRTTDPSDIVGIHSIPEMEKGRFVRITDGKLPKAHLIFLDEIFKGNDAVLNILLSAYNEGVFYNDGKAEKVERRMSIGASNEFPQEDELEAFYDRFIFRHWVNYIKTAQNRIKMAKISRQSKHPEFSQDLTTITLDEIDQLQQFVYEVEFSDEMEKKYDKLCRDLSKENIEISDRRYAKGQEVMMASAMLNGRDKVTIADFKALKYVFWGKDAKQIEATGSVIHDMLNVYEIEMKELVDKAQDMKNHILGMSADDPVSLTQAIAEFEDVRIEMAQKLEEAQKQGMDTPALKEILEEVDVFGKEIERKYLGN